MAYTPPGETRRRVYEFVRDRLLAGNPPSIREVQDGFGFRSVESARAQMDALVRAGLLVKTPGVSRGYRLPGPRGAVGLAPPLRVPLLGRVQAGALAAAVHEPDGYVVVDPRPNPDDLFALTVRGDSMTGVGILPGDVVIVRRQPEARAGDIVVALVHGLEDEATVKTLRRAPRANGASESKRSKSKRDDGETPGWILQPENPNYEPIVPEPGTLRILGKVIEVRRTLGS